MLAGFSKFLHVIPPLNFLSYNLIPFERKKFIMSTELHPLPEEEKGDATKKNSEISLPNIERPDGPFEHSGETAGWTKEEKEEKAEGDQQQAGKEQKS